MEVYTYGGGRSSVVSNDVLSDLDAIMLHLLWGNSGLPFCVQTCTKIPDTNNTAHNIVSNKSAN